MIRLAVPDDAVDLMRMGEAFHRESGYADKFPFDQVSFAHSLTRLGLARLLFVGEKDGKVVGMAGVDAAPSICNYSVLFARDVFWYVDPEYRKGLGRKLLAALETAAGDYGATAFDVVAEPGPRSKPLEYLYERAGFNPAEKTFRKWLKPCQSHRLSAA